MGDFLAAIICFTISAWALLLAGATCYLIVESEGSTRGKMVVVLIIEWVLVAAAVYAALWR